MKSLVFFGLLVFSFVTQAANFEPKALGGDLTAATRAMDLLFAREEMREQLSVSLAKTALSAMAADSEIDKKVALMTNQQSLENCKVNHSETRSPEGDKTDALIEYAGTDCPLSIKAKVNMVMGNGTAKGDVVVELELLSPKLRAELDIEKIVMPVKLDVAMTQTPDGGVSMVSTTKISGQIYSQKWGLVHYLAEANANMVFGSAGMKMIMVNDEIYESSGQKVTFKQVVESDMVNNVEKYFVNGKEVSKSEYETQHQTVSLPGFDDQKIALARPHLCQGAMYDTAQYSLDQVRQAIKTNSIGSLTAAETLMPIYITETGKFPFQVPAMGEMLEMEVAVTPDVARFNFEKSNHQTGEKESLGRMTAVLGDKVDLTKVIKNRVVRLVCEPK